MVCTCVGVGADKPICLIFLKFLIIMRHTIYNGIENLTKKEIVNGRASEKKNVRATLADFALSIESAYKQLTATGSTARNAANACKGTYKTALAVVANCYPYQTATGELCNKTKEGFRIKNLKGTATAYNVVKTAVCNFIDYKTGRKSELVTIVEPVNE